MRREKVIRYGALAVTAVVLVLGLGLGLLMGGQGQLRLGFAVPRVSPTATITPTPTVAELRVTPAPTPILVQVVREYPPQAVDLVADGKVLFTMESAQVARSAVERYLNEMAQVGLGADERLLKAGFEQKLTLEAPSGQGELLTPDEAVSVLKADEGLLPVVRTVVRCAVEAEPVETVVREAPQLPRGSRIIRNAGVSGYTLYYYETLYRGQAAFSEVRTNSGFAVGPGQADRVVEDGGYHMEEASAEAGPKAVAIDGFSPVWPAAGAVTGSFGVEDGRMRYGVEITGESVTRVVAPAEGVVIYCGQRGHLGLVIDILHDETGCVSRIIGCERALVELYQRVKKGEQVGVMPEPVSGRLVSIRYELLLDGLPVNPEKYLPSR